MSTASAVRETRGLDGDAAWRTLAAIGSMKLVWQALARLRAADGFSHARSLAYGLSLVVVQGLIALVACAVAFHQAALTRTILDSVQLASPGPAGQLLEWAAAQAQHVGREHRFLPLVLGLAGTMVTATTAAGQIIRGVNRLYGIESDGPFLRKYARALALAAIVVTTVVGAGIALTLGHQTRGAAGQSAHVAWVWLRWPLVVALASAAFGGILRFAPRRRQPRWSWLAFGGTVGVAGWIMVTLALALTFRVSSTVRVYGPLAGIVALQLWTYCTAVATFFGAAIAAELEAVRSGAAPRRSEKG
jgi:uncharacterized BrkB/YihY/UPF0761 family membrane protein